MTHPAFTKFVSLMAEETGLRYKKSWNDAGWNLDDDILEFVDDIITCDISVPESQLLDLPAIADQKRRQFN
jgi:hypothetical protein